MEQATPSPYFVLDKNGESEIIVKQSRFIGFSEPLISADALSSEAALKNAANERLNQIGKQFHDARHLCFAYRIKKDGDSNQLYEKYSDDGEPIRTGGFPILQLLQGQALENSIAVVVRYFGGVKLGPGGLARAYRSCARESLEMSGRIEVVPRTVLHWEIPYDLLATLEYWLKDQESLRIKEKTFGEKISIVFEIRSDCFIGKTVELAEFLQIPHQNLTKEKM